MDRNFRELDLQENEVEDNCSHFLESFTSFVSLNIACLEGEVNVSVLERLVSKCSNLRNHSMPLDRLACLLRRAPQLADIGTGRLAADPCAELYAKLHSAFLGCQNLRSLSGIWEVVPSSLPTIYSVCDGLH